MPDSALNDLQVDVLRLFFSLPTSDGFILAGGAGLVAVGLSERPTEDIDLFAATASIGVAGDGLERAAEGRGWVIERVQDSPTFRRLVIATDAGRSLLVDLARDAGPLSEVAVTPVGPAYPAEELAARKVLALFDRAALRDFVDVARVADRYGRAELLLLAAEIDEGFDIVVFIEMLGTLERFEDDDIRVFADPAELRSFVVEWIDVLDRELH